jgi:hypothetical protein
MDAQFLCSSNLICICLSQNRRQERLLELAYRFGILKAAFVHLQNDLFELFLQGGTSRSHKTQEKFKGCDIGYALVACSREGASNVDARTVTAF